MYRTYRTVPICHLEDTGTVPHSVRYRTHQPYIESECVGEYGVENWSAIIERLVRYGTPGGLSVFLVSG